MDDGRTHFPPRWLPNAISVVRVLLVPVWLWCAEACRAAVQAGETGDSERWLATAVLVTIGVSDVVDGWLARRFDLATGFGATLDAVADKLAQVALVTWLTVRPMLGGATGFTQLPLAFMAVLIARDMVLLTGYLVLRARRGEVKVVHRAHGKIASVMLFVLLVAVSANALPTWIPTGLTIITVVVVVSTVSYFQDGMAQLRARAT